MRSTLAIILLTCAVVCCANYGHAQRHGHHCGASHPSVAPHAGHVYVMPYPTHGGYAAPAGKSAYAYGWFGVKSRQHKGVHFGYYNNRKQWSYR